jgi:hypothetical protein
LYFNQEIIPSIAPGFSQGIKNSNIMGFSPHVLWEYFRTEDKLNGKIFSGRSWSSSKNYNPALSGGIVI